MYRDDYARAGIRMLPVVEPDGATTARQMLLYAIGLLLFSMVPLTLRMTGWFYAASAMLLGLWLLKVTVRVTGNLTTATARAVLIASVIYLPGLYAAMVLDRVF
jgi:protoheme IX farnesyltransferase